MEAKEKDRGTRECEEHIPYCHPRWINDISLLEKRLKGITSYLLMFLFVTGCDCSEIPNMGGILINGGGEGKVKYVIFFISGGVLINGGGGGIMGSWIFFHYVNNVCNWKSFQHRYRIDERSVLDKRRDICRNYLSADVYSVFHSHTHMVQVGEYGTDSVAERGSNDLLAGLCVDLVSAGEWLFPRLSDFGIVCDDDWEDPNCRLPDYVSLLRILHSLFSFVLGFLWWHHHPWVSFLF